MIEINGLTKCYKNRIAVNELSLKIDDGEIFGLLGLNGAGKTTTIKMLSGIAEPTKGSATVYGHALSDVKGLKSVIGISPQESAVSPVLTVKENLVFVATLYGFDNKDAKTRAGNLMRKFDLIDRAKDKAKSLSGGLCRRLSIAMALISEPKVLFLDEPTLGLDILARRELWSIIKSLKKEMTVVLTTHYLEETEALCDKIAIMRDGKLVAVGTSDELIKLSGKENFEEAFIKLSGESA